MQFHFRFKVEVLVRVESIIKSEVVRKMMAEE